MLSRALPTRRLNLAVSTPSISAGREICNAQFTTPSPLFLPYPSASTISTAFCIEAPGRFSQLQNRVFIPAKSLSTRSLPSPASGNKCDVILTPTAAAMSAIANWKLRLRKLPAPSEYNIASSIQGYCFFKNLRPTWKHCTECAKS